MLQETKHFCQRSAELLWLSGWWCAHTFILSYLNVSVNIVMNYLRRLIFIMPYFSCFWKTWIYMDWLHDPNVKFSLRNDGLLQFLACLQVGIRSCGLLMRTYLCISVMIYLFQFSISHIIYIWVRDLTLAVRVSLRMLGTWKSLIVLSMHLLEPILGTGWSASAHQYQVPQKLSTAWSLLHEPWTWRFTLLGSSRVEKGLGDMFNSAICHCKVS